MCPNPHNTACPHLHTFAQPDFFVWRIQRNLVKVNHDVGNFFIAFSCVSTSHYRSSKIVTGPSLWISTSMWAPKTPVSTGTP